MNYSENYQYGDVVQMWSRNDHWEDWYTIRELMDAIGAYDKVNRLRGDFRIIRRENSTEMVVCR